MRAPIRAVTTGALVGNNDRHRPPRTYRTVQTPHLVARAAPLAALEQHRAHRPDPRPERLDIHQRPVPARATVAPVPFGTAVPRGGSRMPMWVHHSRGGAE